MHIYTYDNQPIVRKSIHSTTVHTPKYTSRYTESHKVSTGLYLTVYGFVAMIDVIACAEAFAAIAKLIGG